MKSIRNCDKYHQEKSAKYYSAPMMSRQTSAQWRTTGENRHSQVRQKIDIVEYIEEIAAEDAAEDDAVATEDVEINEE